MLYREDVPEYLQVMGIPIEPDDFRQGLAQEAARVIVAYINSAEPSSDGSVYTLWSLPAALPVVDRLERVAPDLAAKQRYLAAKRAKGEPIVLAGKQEPVNKIDSDSARTVISAFRSIASLEPSLRRENPGTEHQLVSSGFMVTGVRTLVDDSTEVHAQHVQVRPFTSGVPLNERPEMVVAEVITSDDRVTHTYNNVIASIGDRPYQLAHYSYVYAKEDADRDPGSLIDNLIADSFSVPGSPAAGPLNNVMTVDDLRGIIQLLS